MKENDLISRQAAIKTLEKGLPSEPLKSKYTEGITVGFGLAITWIKQLPAVQTCDDAVSRQQAIDALESIGSLDTEADKKYARSVFEALPSAQPKVGKWIRLVKHHKDDEQEYGYYEISCSECGAIRKIGWRDARFCPNCGAEMRSYEDEID